MFVKHHAPDGETRCHRVKASFIRCFQFSSSVSPWPKEYACVLHLILVKRYRQSLSLRTEEQRQIDGQTSNDMFPIIWFGAIKIKIVIFLQLQFLGIFLMFSMNTVSMFLNYLYHMQVGNMF